MLIYAVKKEESSADGYVLQIRGKSVKCNKLIIFCDGDNEDCLHL
jgi:hypothetical protein